MSESHRGEHTPGTPLTTSGAADLLSARFRGGGDSDPAPEPETEVEETEVVEDLTEEVLEDETEDVQAGDTVETDEPEEESEEEPFKSVADLLEAADVTADDIFVTARSNGQDYEVTLEEAIRGYQRQKDYDGHMAEIREERARLESMAQNVYSIPEVANKVAEIEQLGTMVSMALKADATALRGEYDKVDWTTLRKEDPVSYAALEADFRRQSESLMRKQQEIGESFARFEAERKETLAKQFETRKLSERQKLIDRNPELKDRAVMEERGNQLMRYLTEEYGAQPEELQQMIDHRMLDLAWKAYQFDEIKRQGKKAKTAPKSKKGVRLLRPKSPGARNKVNKSQKSADAAREKLARTHSQADGIAALRARWSK